jgi:hypothetical protein
VLLFDVVVVVVSSFVVSLLRWEIMLEKLRWELYRELRWELCREYILIKLLIQESAEIVKKEYLQNTKNYEKKSW